MLKEKIFPALKKAPILLAIGLLLSFIMVQRHNSHNMTEQVTRAKNPNAKIAICYYRSSLKEIYPYSKIKFENLTHIAHAFIWPNADGSLVVDSNFVYPELNYAAHLHGVKVLISLGGWGRDKGFGPMAANPKSRKTFTRNLVKFCLVNHYDGADIDWEYPRKADKENFVKLVSELRQAFNSSKIELLTAALPAKDYRDGYDIMKLKDLFNWAGIMTYDFHGPWTNHYGYNSPLYSTSKDTCGSVDNSINYYLKKGLPREKLCIGMAFYGRMFNSQDTKGNWKGGDAVDYTFSAKKISEGWEYNWDKSTRVPYLLDPAHKQIITFDDTASIKQKCDYIMKTKLRGTIVWALKHDYDGKEQPLLDVLGSNLLFNGVSGQLGIKWKE